MLKFLRRRMHCREAVALMTDYLEGALSGRDRARLEEHLAACAHCGEYLAQMRATIEIAGRVTPEDLSDDAVAELIGLYRRWRADGVQL